MHRAAAGNGACILETGHVSHVSPDCGAGSRHRVAPERGAPTGGLRTRWTGALALVSTQSAQRAGLVGRLGRRRFARVHVRTIGAVRAHPRSAMGWLRGRLVAIRHAGCSREHPGTAGVLRTSWHGRAAATPMQSQCAERGVDRIQVPEPFAKSSENRRRMHLSTAPSGVHTVHFSDGGVGPTCCCVSASGGKAGRRATSRKKSSSVPWQF